jgi:hypothetical protein
MHVTVSTASLLDALRVLAPALSRSNILRTASCAWTATRGQLTLRASSLDWDAQTTLEAETRKEGTAWIPADIIRSLPWGRFPSSLTVRSGSAEAEIRGEGIAYSIALLPPSTAAALPPATAPCARIPGSVLGRLLIVGSAASRPLGTPREDDAADPDHGTATPRREAAWLDISRSAITVSGTDRARVTRATAPADTSASVRAALPLHALLTLARASSRADLATILRPRQGDDTSRITVRAGAATLTARTLAALPPDPSGVDLAPGSRRATARLRASALAAALRAALAVAGTEPHPTASLATGPDRLEVRIHGTLGRAAASAPAEAVSEPGIAVAVSARALLATIALLGDAPLTLGLDPHAAFAAEDGPITAAGLVATVAAPEPVLGTASL